MTTELEMSAGAYRLRISPERGGSILAFDWQGAELMRSATGDTILDVACFPLVPFSNRIAHGHFLCDGIERRLTPNFPGSAHPHALHGFGWLAAWTVREAAPTRCVLEHVYEPGEWPWAYVARETFALDERGLTLTLAVTNRSLSDMPAGLGFHPYFPRDEATVYHGLHMAQWQTSADGLPEAIEYAAAPRDWWGGRPAASRTVDTVYAGRVGDLRIDWPSRNLSLSLKPDDALDHTVVFTPSGEGYFCVEPVSHATNAINTDAMTMLPPGATLTASLRMETRHV
ncbi:aldose 1-epimerase [Novosphingobium sp. PS1R-30]|uniref:Aldose 1-epimerase n=1 Tax=Novosphingobium anseongense TaxID=3133436 RepID=A0ABU8S1R9_9SPHN